MSLEKSKFRFDYQTLSTLPNQFVDNLYYLKNRQKHLDNVSEIQKRIAELETSLEAETYFIANMVLADNVFPRFGGYEDFIADESFVYSSKAENERKTFGALATIVKNSEHDENKPDYVAFNAQLDNFIWLFFNGGDTIDNSSLVIDYENMDYISSGYCDNYPPSTTYKFNVFNKNNGNTYMVSFGFYDLRKAISFSRMREIYPNQFIHERGDNRIPFQIIRNCEYGSICCYIEKQEKNKHGYEAESENTKYIASHDPIEIAAFINNEIVKEGK